jgi:CheY-like chemotaxis protein
MSNTTVASKTCVTLIIEDDQDDIVLLQRALKRVSSELGIQCEISTFPNGMEALSSVAVRDLTSRLPNVVIVDLNMPIMGGEQFLRVLRRELELPDLPAAVLTTSSEKPVHDRAFAAGADYVFVKPNSMADLDAIAREILHVGAAGAQ